MARPQELRAEANAMAAIERAVSQAKELGERSLQRVLDYAQQLVDEHKTPAVSIPPGSMPTLEDGTPDLSGGGGASSKSK